MKRMKHDVHGFHHPQSGAEEVTMRANGWTDDVPVEAVPAPEAEAAPKRAYTRKATKEE